MTSVSLDDKAKTHEERIALLAIAEQLRSLSGFVQRLADSTNRNVGVYSSVVKGALPKAFAALNELQAQFGDVNGGTQPRFSNGQMAETAVAAGGVLTTALGVQEPPQDSRVFNRRKADGSFRSMSEFFDR